MLLDRIRTAARMAWAAYTCRPLAVLADGLIVCAVAAVVAAII